MNKSAVAIRSVAGDELEKLIPALAELRIRVFAEYPYLYCGTTIYEAKYLRNFAHARDALVVAASDSSGNIVGCATGSALAEHHAEFSAPLAAAGYDLSSTFYFGESVLDSAWRGRGLGHAFFDARETHAKKLGYQRACFCAVLRPDDELRRPENYSPLDSFWHKRSYQRIKGLETFFHWPETAGGPAITHPMAYWLREF